MDYDLSMISCCLKRDIVVPCMTLNHYTMNNDNNNNNNHSTTTTTTTTNKNTNTTIQRNNNNNNNPPNNSSEIYDRNNYGYKHQGLMVGLEEIT